MEDHVRSARQYFPRGLIQPAGSFRFSLDALLLAAFAARLSGDGRQNLLDLGCGCGVVALGFMLLKPDSAAVGLETQKNLAEAAGQNAALLGFSRQFKVSVADLECIRAHEDLEPHAGAGSAFELVTANPPYRLTGSGREPRSALRRKALFGGPSTLEAFCRAAALSLKDDGLFCLIFPFARTGELFTRLAGQGLFPALTMTVTTRAEQGPSLSLVAARKTGYAPPGKTPSLPGLLLYSGVGRDKTLSSQAREFCPFLDPGAEAGNAANGGAARAGRPEIRPDIGPNKT